MTQRFLSPTATAIAAALVLTGSACADQVRLPPSVGATPIEIPLIDPDAPLVMQRQGTGSTSATPIEIPRIDPNAPFKMMTPGAAVVPPLPPPLPGQGIEQLDPRRHASAFGVEPLPLPGTATVGKLGAFSYALLNDNTMRISAR